MASDETILLQLELCLAALPQHAAKLTDRQIEMMGRAWLEGLEDIPDQLLAVACRSYRDTSHWLPAVADIREAAVDLMRQVSPANQTALEAWADVWKAILRHGTAGEWVLDENEDGTYRPVQFANPITANVVRRMGWVNICNESSPSGVLRAQFERYYEAEAERLSQTAQQSLEVRAFVAALAEAQSAPQLPGGNAGAGIIRQIAEARRV